MRRLPPRAFLVLLGWIVASAVTTAAGAPNPRFTGAPFTRTWSAEDYGAAPGNRAILQHPKNGFIYVANGAGLLEFDGVRKAFGETRVLDGRIRYHVPGSRCARPHLVRDR